MPSNSFRLAVFLLINIQMNDRYLRGHELGVQFDQAFIEELHIMQVAIALLTDDEIREIVAHMKTLVMSPRMLTNPNTK